MKRQYVAGIDLGGTSIKAGFCTLDGSVLQEMERPTPKGTYSTVLITFQEMLQEMVYIHQLSWDQIVGVGVGVPALLDVENGFLYEVVNLGWRDVPLKKELEELLKIPCFIDNDANTAAIGEMWQGTGQGSKHLICITVGTGIGGGLILNGDIYRGSIGLAGEIGHFTVRPEGGHFCNCGNRGCLETETSASAIVRYGKNAVTEGTGTILAKIWEEKGKLTARDIMEGAKLGDSACVQIIDQVGYFLGLSLAQISNVLNPEKIIIGGGVSKAGEFFLERIRSHFKKYALKKVSEIIEIVPAQLGNSAGWIGAAWLAHRNLQNNGGI